MASNMGYMFPVYPIVNGVVILLNIMPIYIHWKAGNIATTALGLWVIALQITCWIGTVVWRNNIRNDYPIWGDIVSFIQAAWPSAIAACNFCIQYRLWTIARAKTVFISKEDKQRQLYSTLVMCIGVPVFVALLHYIVQGHRYNLYEDLGPMATTYNVTLAYPLYWMVDLVIVLVTTVYSGMTIRLLLARRRELEAVLNCGFSNINHGKYIRLLCLASTSIALHLPFSLWVIGQNVVLGVQPWISWEDTQSNWTRIGYYPRKVMEIYPWQVPSLSTYFWSVTFTGFVYFAFFGFGDEATSYYVKLIGLILRPFGVRYPRSKRRSAMERTWLDVLLRRPGQPRRFTYSTRSWNSQRSPTGPLTSNMLKHSQSSGATVIQQGQDEVFDLGLYKLDLLDTSEARDQTEAPTYARPGQALQGGIDSRPRIEESDNTADKEENREPGASADRVGNPTVQDKDADMEAQELVEEAARREQERIRLELHPELTDQITF